MRVRVRRHDPTGDEPERGRSAARPALMGQYAHVRRAISGWSLVAVACIIVLGCGDESTQPARFESSRYDYSLRLPERWSTVSATRTLEPGDPPLTANQVTDILGRNASTRVSQMDPPGVIVAAQKLPGDAQAWTDTVVGVVASQKQCERPTERIAVRVDGERADMLVYPDCPHGSGLHHLWVAVTHGGRGYHIVWFNRAADAKTDQDALRALLADFNFTD